MNILGLARHGLNSFEQIAIVCVLFVAFLSLFYAWLLRKTVMRKDKGTAKMQEVWNAIRVGADSYLNRQLKRILPLIGVLTVALFLSVYIVPASAEAVREFGQKNAQVIVAIGRTVAFIMGACFSLLVGQLGMRMAIQANVRAASAARRGFNEALSIAYYAGTITGMLTDGLGLFGGTVIFIVFGTAAPDALLGFGFGGTLLALFMRVGGGIYTKAADVGADLVGKVEAGIPEDDPRNPAVIADLVGDNVGDCAGRGADLFESTAAENIGAMILGATLAYKNPGLVAAPIAFILFPLVARAFGLIASIVGVFMVKAKSEAEDPMKSLNRGYAWAAALALVGFVLTTRWLLFTESAPQAWWHFALCGVIGILT
ncbi:MAG TPA: sodium/proton-translocating pyrophosphatase, partial [Terriglobales bacterium]|nr:sodium/proton-translocating pyrophosphatase [Terriglobales bacterium]